MDGNVKIAKRLVFVARLLVAENEQQMQREIAKNIEDETKGMKNQAFSNPEATLDKITDIMKDSGLDEQTLKEFEKAFDVKNASRNCNNDGNVVIAKAINLSEDQKKLLYNDGKGLRSECFSIDGKGIMTINPNTDAVVDSSVDSIYRGLKENFKLNVTDSKYFSISTDKNIGSLIDINQDEIVNCMSSYLIPSEAQSLATKIESFANQHKDMFKYGKMREVYEKIVEKLEPIIEFANKHSWLGDAISVAVIGAVTYICKKFVPVPWESVIQSLVVYFASSIVTKKRITYEEVAKRVKVTQ